MQMIGARRDDSQSTNGWGNQTNLKTTSNTVVAVNLRATLITNLQWTLTTIFRFECVKTTEKAVVRRRQSTNSLKTPKLAMARAFNE